MLAYITRADFMQIGNETELNPRGKREYELAD